MTVKDPNIHGLARYIPSAIRRAVRTDCGFGCVLCGNGFTQYAHLDPPFEHATEHDYMKMALACYACHGKQTNGLLALETLIKAREKPFSKRAGFAKDQILVEHPLIVQFGSNKFENVTSIVRTMDGAEWFSVSPATDGSIYPNINAKFYDKNGIIELEIKNNEWICSANNWDGELKGNILRIRRGRNNVCLQIRFDPPNTIHLERMKMYLHDTGITVDPSGNAFIYHNGGKVKLQDNVLKSGGVFLLPEVKSVRPCPNNRRTSIFKCGECNYEFERYSAHMDKECCIACECGGTAKALLGAPQIMQKTGTVESRTDIERARPKEKYYRPGAGNISMINNVFSGYDGIDLTGATNLDFRGNLLT